jgi:uncharacterized protein (TIGR02757 family)
VIVANLKQFLDQVFDQYHSKRYLDSDPLEFVHKYKSVEDKETVALVAALLAYGNVKQIRRSVATLLGCMASVAPEGPAAFVDALGRPAFEKKARQALDGFVHRFNTGADLFLLLRLLHESRRAFGSLGAHFLSGLSVDDRDIGKALNTLISDWRSDAGSTQRYFRYLLTAPADGSCCKRWCMLLRWMGRSDELDPGLWSKSKFGEQGLRTDQLVIPLDTHTGRISQALGLTKRRSLGWDAALEVTDKLRACDSDDPVRYDFALARLGILDLCQNAFNMEICGTCPLRQVCQHAQR